MHKPLTFTERMELGKDLAVLRRNRGVPTGQHASWDRIKPTVQDDNSFRAAFARAKRSYSNSCTDALAQYAIEASGDDYSIDPPFFVWREGRWSRP